MAFTCKHFNYLIPTFFRRQFVSNLPWLHNFFRQLFVRQPESTLWWVSHRKHSSFHVKHYAMFFAPPDRFDFRDNFTMSFNIFISMINWLQVHRLVFFLLEKPLYLYGNHLKTVGLTSTEFSKFSISPNPKIIVFVESCRVGVWCLDSFNWFVETAIWLKIQLLHWW